nr:DUF4998 domain-containing protein [uncultured Pedobacter sp.]
MGLKLKYYITIAAISIIFIACSKMDSTYIDFTKKGSITYVGSADSVKVHSGKNRMKLSWKLIDPTATKAVIYWNNKSDSLSVPIVTSNESNIVDLWLNDMTEGSYSFDIYLFDKNNNKSIMVNAIGQVYGNNYIESLLDRPIKRAIYEKDTVQITWGIPDVTVIGTEVKYTDKQNVKHVLNIPVDSLTTKLAQFNFSQNETFEYRTLYVPDSLSIDTFYTVAKTVKATGPPVEYNRSTWTSGTEDYDIPSGRTPQNALDGKTSTVWHMDKTHGYPHTASFDMGTVNYVTGLFYVQRTPLDGAAKLVEIQISTDNVTWNSLGAFTMENSGTKQYLEFFEPRNFRYFKMVFKSDYKNGLFTAIAEIGAYKR